MQKIAVETIEGPVLTLAGAGSGKTKTIVHRLGYLIHVAKVPAESIVAVTFTNKAAMEMQERCLSLIGPIAQNIQIRTYHSFGLYLLRHLAGYIDYPSSFTIWDDQDQEEVIQNILTNKIKFHATRTQIKYFSTQISSFKDNLITPEELREKLDLDQNQADILEELYIEYELQKKLAFAVDFSDLLYQTVLILEKNPQVLEKLQEKYKYYLVDEYQDTNLAQYRLINLLASKSRNLFVVGDDDQAIYGWRGADVRNILNFQDDYPEAKVIKLEENYRSTQSILNLANAIIEKNYHRHRKTLFSRRKEGCLPKLCILPNDQEEAHYVVKKIEEFIGKIPLSEIAILYRTHAQSRLFEEALLSCKIPYRIYGGIAFFARKEVKDVLAYLRFMENPFDDVSFIRAITTPARGVGEKALQKIFAKRYENPEKSLLDIISNPNFLEVETKTRKAILKFAELILMLKSLSSSLSLPLLLEELLASSGLYDLFEEEDLLLGKNRLENLDELKNSMARFCEIYPQGTLKDYLQQISLYSSPQEIEKSSVESVNLMTIHNAKGLEFQVVFVTGLEESLFPHPRSIQESNIEEERRLFYVAVTRAKDYLFLTRANLRMFHGFQKISYPSCFLLEIDEDLWEEDYPDNTNSPRASFRKGFSYSKGPFVKNKLKNISLKTGEFVRHPKFGTGKVIGLEKDKEHDIVQIQFNDGKIRKFLLDFTPLEKL